MPCKITEWLIIETKIRILLLRNTDSCSIFCFLFFNGLH